MTPLESTQNHVENVLEKLEKWFTSEMKLTLVARCPTNPECHLIFTRDDLQAVAMLFIDIEHKRLHHGDERPGGL